MNHSVDSSRRNLLKFIAGTPLLPLAGGLAGMVSSSVFAADLKASSVRFVPMDAPTLSNPAEMATTTVKSSMVVNYTDGSSKTFKLGYKPFFVTGDMVADGFTFAVRIGGEINQAIVFLSFGTEFFSHIGF